MRASEKGFIVAEIFRNFPEGAQSPSKKDTYANVRRGAL
jgi:hypothetical protein